MHSLKQIPTSLECLGLMGRKVDVPRNKVIDLPMEFSPCGWVLMYFGILAYK